MKIQVRQGVFETNSSSMHSITMCSDSTYKKWINGELIYDLRGEKLITPEERDRDVLREKEENERLRQEKGEENLFYQVSKNTLSLEAGGKFHNYFTYEDFKDGRDIYDTTYDTSFTTESGEVVHAFGYHGKC